MRDPFSGMREISVGGEEWKLMLRVDEVTGKLWLNWSSEQNTNGTELKHEPRDKAASFSRFFTFSRGLGEFAV